MCRLSWKWSDYIHLLSQRTNLGERESKSARSVPKSQRAKSACDISMTRHKLDTDLLSFNQFESKLSLWLSRRTRVVWYENDRFMMCGWSCINFQNWKNCCLRIHLASNSAKGSIWSRGHQRDKYKYIHRYSNTPTRYDTTDYKVRKSPQFHISRVGE